MRWTNYGACFDVCDESTGNGLILNSKPSPIDSIIYVDNRVEEHVGGNTTEDDINDFIQNTEQILCGNGDFNECI